MTVVRRPRPLVDADGGIRIAHGIEHSRRTEQTLRRLRGVHGVLDQPLPEHGADAALVADAIAKDHERSRRPLHEGALGHA